MTILDFEEIAKSINFQVLQSEERKKIAQQSQLNLELLIKAGIASYVNDHHLTEEQSEELQKIHKTANFHA
jgi:hypothetical protein